MTSSLNSITKLTIPAITNNIHLKNSTGIKKRNVMGIKIVKEYPYTDIIFAYDGASVAKKFNVKYNANGIAQK